MLTFERDPEELGPEHPDDTELRMDVAASIHDFTPGPDGKCTGHLVRHGLQGVVCGSRQRYSVFHVDDRTYCCSLDEQGIDCGHNEGPWE